MHTRERCLQRLLLHGAGFTAVALLACERPGQSTELRARQQAAHWRATAVQTGEGALSVRSAGREESPAIVLVNGGPGLTHDYMEDLEYLVTRGFRVICYDQRGVGSSFVPMQNKYALIEQGAGSRSQILKRFAGHCVCQEFTC